MGKVNYSGDHQGKDDDPGQCNKHLWNDNMFTVVFQNLYVCRHTLYKGYHLKTSCIYCNSSKGI